MTRPRAFTLIEVIVAVVLLAVAIPPMVAAVSSASVSQADPINASRARWLASEKLEDIIADRASTSRGYAYIDAANYPAESTLTGFSGFSRSVAIAEADANLSTSGTGCKIVTVTVAWTSPRFGQRTLALSTVVADYTP